MSFTVYHSSAGSGKTYTLVKEYLKLLIEDPSAYRHILAITFTNKAANEMKERVLDALKELSAAGQVKDGSGKNRLLDQLEAETGIDRQMICRHAAIALEMILHHYSDFAIGTIDSFSHKLIRTFAHDFRLSVNFTVELEAEQLLATAVDLMLDEVGRNEPLTNLLVNFIETRLDEDKGWKIEDTLISFAGNLLDEEGQARIQSLGLLTIQQFHLMAGELFRLIREFESKLRQAAGIATQLITTSGVPVASFAYGEKGIAKYFRNLSQGNFDNLTPNSFVVKTVEEDKWFSGKSGKQEREQIESMKAELLDCYRQLQQIIDSQGPDYRLRRMIAQTIYPIAVLNEIQQVLNAFKMQNNLVHISEFNSRIASVIMNEPVPFIYERLGEKYRHLLIDEFQDTSTLQWMNFIPLIENSLASGYFNLVVGDGKQAIYRWRNGDIEQFNALPSIPGSDDNPVLKLREQSLTRHYTGKVLDVNYRSKAEIVKFNNNFYKVIGSGVLSGGKEDVYADVAQKFDENRAGGYVSLEFLPKGKKAEELEEQMFTRILEIVGNVMQANFTQRDIAILCRSNKNASRIAEFLITSGHDVVSAESMLVCNSVKIRFIIAVLRQLFEPPDDIVNEEIRLWLETNRKPGDVLSADTRLGYKILPVYDLCERIIRKYELNQPADAYLQFFMDVVLKFSAKTSHSTVDFLEFWKKNARKFSVNVPEQMDAIKIMTIHKAKGLQFPVVILPFASEARKNTKSYLWVDLEPSVLQGLPTTIIRSDKQMESTIYSPQFNDEQEKSMLDLLNVLYVATTRPEEQLYILTTEPAAKSAQLDALPKFFQYYLESEGIYSSDQSVYEFGTFSQAKEKHASASPDPVTLTGFISTDRSKNLNIRLKAPKSWDPDDPGVNLDRGIRLHTLLSWIKTMADIPGALERARNSGLFGEEEEAAIVEKLDEIIRHPDLAACFSEDAIIKTEPEILTPEGAFYRPDRVIIHNGEVTILDYKTGIHKPEHAQQLHTYAGLITRMGYNKIRPLLVYIEPRINIIEVTHD